MNGAKAIKVGILGLGNIGTGTVEILRKNGALLERHGRRGAIAGRGKLLVFEWDYARLRTWLSKEVERCTGRTWPEVARKVGRLAEWEGEGGEVIGLG